MRCKKSVNLNMPSGHPSAEFDVLGVPVNVLDETDHISEGKIGSCLFGVLLLRYRILIVILVKICNLTMNSNLYCNSRKNMIQVAAQC
ncbi:unnamed protein product [Macrosiphum euphorbiae]|uniref:Uncharacterized protein n=1 Tax=Macrosiphum euphorbiae TaxID=13131 RepID=A0AAV0WWI7_9HEMI|nr:unnamed protein product [Macrosiphum euphorbiae]